MAAERYIRQSMAVFTEFGARGDLAESLTILGKIHLHRSEFEEAQRELKEAIRLGLESNTMPQVYEATVELADCLLQLGDHQEAARLAISVLKNEQVVEMVRQKAQKVMAVSEARVKNSQLVT